MRPRASSVVAVLAAVLVTGWTAQMSAQTPYVPYFGKNNVHYDKFDWQIYTTDHFEIFFYPDLKQHIEREIGRAHV